MAVHLTDAEPVEPAAKTAGLGEPVDAAHRFDERQLNDVVRVGIGSQELENDAGHVARVAAKQLRERRLIPGCAEPHELLVSEVGPVNALNGDHQLLLGLSAPEGAKL